MSKNFPQLCISFLISKFYILVKINFHEYPNKNTEVTDAQKKFIHIFMQIFMSFYDGAMKATNMLQLYTANFLYGTSKSI